MEDVERLDGSGKRFLVVASRFNEYLTDRLVEGAREELLARGVREDGIRVIRVPGAFEIPYALSRFWDPARYDAAVVLGCIIRGQTHHHEIIAQEVARGAGALARERGIPLGFGVVIAETPEQAAARCTGADDHRGRAAARAALELLALEVPGAASREVEAPAQTPSGGHPSQAARGGRSRRRRSRELALQAIYQIDLLGSQAREQALAPVLEEAHPKVREFALRLVDGCVTHWAEIDEQIRSVSEHWRLERIGAVDRTILRIGIYELLHGPDVPPRAVLDEAVELAKAYGGKDSGAFVNGLLDRIYHRSASREAALPV
jgi:transcription antitermination factor NusB/6,7-dimethyl-8-ribityllumazine synthase